jgi:hypothetical protein
LVYFKIIIEKFIKGNLKWRDLLQQNKSSCHKLKTPQKYYPPSDCDFLTEVSVEPGAFF